MNIKHPQDEHRHDWHGTNPHAPHPPQRRLRDWLKWLWGAVRGH